METRVRDWLTAWPVLADLVQGRVFPLRAPQGSLLPAITYQRISGGQEYDLDGQDGLEHPVLQLDCYAQDYDRTKALAKLVKAAMHSASMDAAGFGGCEITREIDLEDDETALPRVSMDFSLWHKE